MERIFRHSIDVPIRGMENLLDNDAVISLGIICDVYEVENKKESKISIIGFDKEGKGDLKNAMTFVSKED